MLNRKYQTVQVDKGLRMPKGFIALSGATGTLNALAGRITTASLATAAGASQALTISNNAVLGPNDTVNVQYIGGTNTTRGIVITTTASAGSFVATIYNTSGSALNGTVIFDYFIVRG